MRKLHSDLIKPPPEGGFSGAISESGHVLMGKTSVRKFMPPQVKN